RPVHQDAEPAEGIDPLVGSEHGVGDAPAADAVIAVAAGDEVAVQFLLDALVPVADLRAIGLDVMQADILGLVDGGGAGRGPPLHEVPGDLGLAIDDDRLADQVAEADAVALSAEGEFDAVMD